MKHFIIFLFAATLCSAPCHAQFGALKKIIKTVKDEKKKRQSGANVFGAEGEKTLNQIYKEMGRDSIYAEMMKNAPEIDPEMMKNNPTLKKIMELQGDTAALNKYMKEQYGGMTPDEIARKTASENGIDFDSKEMKEALEQTKNLGSFTSDPIFQKVLKEQRSLTADEARYLNETYGTSFDYEGMEAYNDSIGVFAHVDGKLNPMGVNINAHETDECPGLESTASDAKQYVDNWIDRLKHPLADREIVDSVQTYLVYECRHSDVQFKGKARFTIYANNDVDRSDKTLKEALLREQINYFNAIDPNNILIFKVHKGLNCRYVDYRYSLVKYKESELMDYMSKQLSEKSLVNKNWDKSTSDTELQKEMDQMLFDFKKAKLAKMITNNDKLVYANAINPAKNMKFTTAKRNVGGHVTAIDLTVDAEPGEYGIIIKDPETEEYMKQQIAETKDDATRKQLQNYDQSQLSLGAFFFTVK